MWRAAVVARYNGKSGSKGLTRRQNPQKWRVNARAAGACPLWQAAEEPSGKYRARYVYRKGSGRLRRG